MKSQSDAENHKKSRLIAEKVDCRIMSRQMPNIAICRGKRQISRFRTHRDKLLPLIMSELLKMETSMREEKRRGQGGGSLCDTGSSLCRFWESLPKARLCF